MSSQHIRQGLHATLSRSSLTDIHQCWPKENNDSYEELRPSQTGMVMAVGRADAYGEPFNIGEVAVTRSAIRLSTGQVGVGYVMGSDKDHALQIAILDAMVQIPEKSISVIKHVIDPLKKKITRKNNTKKQETDSSMVEFLTMVRGEDS